MAKQPTIGSDVYVVDEEFFTNGTVTTFKLIVDIQYDDNQTFIGTARRHPDDKHNPDVAAMVARARAYDSLSRSLMRRANGLVKHVDDNRNSQNLNDDYVKTAHVMSQLDPNQSVRDNNLNKISVS